jgi:hypothetical protein
LGHRVLRVCSLRQLVHTLLRTQHCTADGQAREK